MTNLIILVQLQKHLKYVERFFLACNVLHIALTFFPLSSEILVHKLHKS